MVRARGLQEMTLKISAAPARLGFVALLAAATMLAGQKATFGQGAGKSIDLAPHIAIYDLTLKSSRGKRALESVRGRIVYDFSGSSCEGYALQFRQVTELDSGEGKVALSDLRTTTWEEGEGKSFRFKSQNYMNQEQIGEVDGSADREKSGVAVKLSKPEDKSFEAGKVVFPTEHMRLLIEAAEAGKTLLEVDVYDGSESGQKIYHSLSVIGHRIAPEQAIDNAGPEKDSLAVLARWPVTISYFDNSREKKADDQPSEQTPVYSISFEMYENGISRALRLDYGDFVIDGKISSLEVKKTAACK
jgi:EipB-like